MVGYHSPNSPDRYFFIEPSGYPPTVVVTEPSIQQSGPIPTAMALSLSSNDQSLLWCCRPDGHDRGLIALGTLRYSRWFHDRGFI